MSQLLSKRPDQFAPGVWPGYFQRAHGVHIWDLDGNKYIDMSIGGIGANVLGYGDPDVDQAVHAAIDAGTSCSLNCPEDVELAELLCELHPWAEMVRFARTGGEAMAIAVRIARAHTGRDRVAFCGYHGWHDWYLAANLSTTNALGSHLLPGLEPRGVPQALAGTALPFHYNRLRDLQTIVAKNRGLLAAIIMEPVRNVLPEPGFLEGVAECAREAGAVLIVDEISAAFRINTGGAHLTFGMTPDIAVFSKALGNGYPIAAIIGKGHVMEAAQHSFISSTYWTERIGPSAALATIRKHQRCAVATHLMAIGTQVQTGWKSVAARYDLPISVGGLPPLSHFHFEGDNTLAAKALFVQLMLEQGFLASTLFYSMYAHTNEHVASYLRAVDSAFGEIVRCRKTGSLYTALRGKPAAAGFARLT